MDSKSRRTAKLYNWFKSYHNFTNIFLFKNFKRRHVGCLSRGNKLEYCTAHSDFNLGPVYLNLDPETLQEMGSIL